MAKLARRDGAVKQTRQLTDYFYDPKVRGILFQVIVVALISWLVYGAVLNTVNNLEAQGIASGFGFLDRTAGFDISQSLIPYENTMTYARAFWVGLLNTLLVAVLGIVFATTVGFMIGAARLSQNWLIAQLATAYVEILRNLPPLLMLFAVYFGVLKTLPSPRESLALPFSSYLNSRGLYVPAVHWEPGFGVVVASLFVAAMCVIAYWAWARWRHTQTGRQMPILRPSLGVIVGIPLLAFLLMGMPLSFDPPVQGRFNLTGGIALLPELIALLVGLSLYTSAFIAEIVRAGIMGVPTGQREAAAALGLKPGQILWLVVFPQAMRIIIPPLTNQYLNLTKNSSLAVAIGYPDLVSVFAGTVLNQTNQAVEVILITMSVYLVLSLLTSLFMNWFNQRMALVER
ncbi:amino-acid transporter subunit; membrane component of ABC superfamily [Candidatus Filomicrobium marinum]|uniref:Amino-acid transporter subunit membrane component of ABC superfamily n=1 Tax=Candidatus Filomicrobium marinum TaxID=1608628 RepID=A0A0D6JB91_9HYPH|nr:amino acid ABC transporter permease [Candidatus Filomicrobium marinum]CFX00693.1 amino-acid transporter subunit; membrane component of ABC superfamily [Candidatus Filomicrobium marinum]CPR15294.1 amino-acid transporter subunit; membrane component of ABC superfamily [Candidatus Filomicrobium marinum]